MEGLDKKGAVGTAGGASGFGETDLEKMRSSIQLLVQHTGPLGTCMDYIQEDVSLMTAELHKWEEDCRKYEAEYEEAKRKTKESLHPLKLELAEVNDQVRSDSSLHQWVFYVIIIILLLLLLFFIFSIVLV